MYNIHDDINNYVNNSIKENKLKLQFIYNFLTSRMENDTSILEYQLDNLWSKVEFDSKKFETLDFELDEQVPNDIINTWKQCYTNKTSDYKVFDTIDFSMTMQIGIIPVNTCMDYTSGIYSKALVSNLDANKKIIFVKNRKGQIIARSILKLTKIKTDDSSDSTPKKKYALIIERVYASDDNPNIPKLISEFVKEHYKDLTILGKSNFENKTAKNENISIFVTYSKNKIQYSDALGGELQEADTGTYKDRDMYVL